MDIVVRKMVEKDISGVQQVAKASWNDTYKGIIPLNIQERFLKSAYSTDTMIRRLKNSFIFVAELERNIIGFANFSPVNKHGTTELGAIYLYPEYQRKGIGTALLEHGINHLEGVKEILIHVEKNNQSGFHFYQAKGFNKVDEFKDTLFGHVVQTNQMILRLDSQ